MVQISVRTNKRVEFVNIDRQVQKVIDESGIQNGICIVFVPHTTAGVTINENADPAVVKDIITELEKIIPYSDNYSHMEGNSDAHIKSSLTGCSETIIITGGRLRMGTWQSIFFCEFDGPRTRSVWIQIIGAEKA
ncbi:YjbQ family protein [bacterium]|nr:YjbQ family protein [bacterium]